MSRVKAYDEAEVLEKAMNLFWKNGYKGTSMQLLEKEMGINKFSIYSSFGSKNALMQASIKCYANKLNAVVEKLRNANGGVEAIKQYFYDFVTFSKEHNLQKGCLMTNTANECIEDNDADIQRILAYYTDSVRDVFADKLRSTTAYADKEIEQKADYLIIAMFGFSSATKVFNVSQLENYIFNIFDHL